MTGRQLHMHSLPSSSQAMKYSASTLFRLLSAQSYSLCCFRMSQYTLAQLKRSSNMHKSLCRDDFYPLIHSHSKWMSYSEKAAYRVKHSIPRTINEWIMNEMMHTEAPTANPYTCGPSREYSLLQDSVECTFNVLHHKEVSDTKAHNVSPTYQLFRKDSGLLHHLPTSSR